MMNSMNENDDELHTDLAKMRQYGGDRRTVMSASTFGNGGF